MVTKDGTQRKRLPTALALTALMVLLAGCTVPIIGGPKTTSYPRPDHLTVDMQPFIDAGCVPSEYERWTCPADSPLAEFGCDHFGRPSDLVGGLDPALPIIECELTPFFRDGVTDPMDLVINIDEEGFFFTEGCMAPAFFRYVVYRDGEFQLLRSEADMRVHFAPVTSADEALSWALAATGSTPYFDPEPIRGYRYLVDELEGTHVTETEDGYRINLFHYQLCGCGPHTTSMTEVLLSEDGHITIGEITPVYEDPEEDGLCVD